MVFRPATPGFVVTLAATICLALVSFGVPMLKSIYFLSATINHDSLQGTATFGVLGYCLQTNSTQACSNATVGWEFDPNALLDLNLPLNIEIPTVVVKWLTYALVLHIVGLGLAGVSAVFGLLAHVREMAMTCFSSCFSGLAAAVVLLAFIFDLVFFFVIRTRIRAVGGTANLGTGMWLTLAAWVMLFFAGFFFGIGRCCFSSRPRGPKGWGKDNNNNNNYGGNVGPGQTGGISHTEAMRMEAIKAEQERKARQAEVGLPAFPTKSESVPLKPEAQYYVEEDSEDEAKPYVPAGAGPQRRGSAGTTTTSYTTNYAGRGRQQVSQAPFPGGYMQGAPGTRTVDQYGNPMPGPQRQQSGNSGYNYNPNVSSSSPPPMPSAQQYLAPGVAVGEVVGHGGRQSSYHSAVSHQTQQPSHFDQPYGGAGSDPYYTHQNQPSQAPQFPAAYPPVVAQQPYNDSQTGHSAYGGYGQTGYEQTNPFHQPQQAYADPYAPTRTYTPPQQQQQQAYPPPQQQPYPPTRQPSVPAVNTSYGGYSDPYAAGEARRSPTSPTGPRGPRGPTQAAYVQPPWEQGGSTNDIINNFSSTPAPPPPPSKSGLIPPGSIPSDAPPSYDLPPGAAPPGSYPQEKR